MIPFLIAGAVGFGIAKLLEEDTKKFADGGEVNLLSDKFTEVGYNTYARNFGVARIDGFNDEKDINILVSAIIEDMYDATGDEQFEDKPFVLILETHAYPEFWSDEYAENIKDMVDDYSINPRNINYLSDAHTYGLGVPLSTDADGMRFKTEEQAIKFLNSKKLNEQISGLGFLSGFHFDKYLNRIGDTGWKYLSEQVGANYEEYAKGGSIGTNSKYEELYLKANKNIQGALELYAGELGIYNMFFGHKVDASKKSKVKKLQMYLEKKYSKYADGGGVGKYNTYKLRAEGLNDFLNFLGTGVYFNVKSFTVEPIGVPDVAVSFETNLSLSEIKAKLREVQDSHVMLETIKPIKEYTGERYEGGGVAKKRKRSLSAQYGQSDRKFDKQLTAKPVGYRFTNAKANQLRKDRYAKPTEAQVKKYLGKGIYKENRRNKSDRDRNEKI